MKEIEPGERGLVPSAPRIRQCKICVGACGPIDKN